MAMTGGRLVMGLVGGSCSGSLRLAAGLDAAVWPPDSTPPPPKPGSLPCSFGSLFIGNNYVPVSLPVCPLITAAVLIQLYWL